MLRTIERSKRNRCFEIGLAHEYFALLGGEYFNTATTRRIERFGQELANKRAYTDFTKFKAKKDNMIVLNHLRIFSICEHHLLPYHGEVSIGYIPNNYIFGLSKFQRAVDKFASKPTIQEELTTEILEFIRKELDPKGAGIQVKAYHTCIMWRGVQSVNNEVITNEFFGNFKDNPQTRNEFLQAIK